jgi:hypothetical protein
MEVYKNAVSEVELESQEMAHGAGVCGLCCVK